VSAWRLGDAPLPRELLERLSRPWWLHLLLWDGSAPRVPLPERWPGARLPIELAERLSRPRWLRWLMSPPRMALAERWAGVGLASPLPAGSVRRLLAPGRWAIAGVASVLPCESGRRLVAPAGAGLVSLLSPGLALRLAAAPRWTGSLLSARRVCRLGEGDGSGDGLLPPAPRGSLHLPLSLWAGQWSLESLRGFGSLCRGILRPPCCTAAGTLYFPRSFRGEPLRYPSGETPRS